MSELFLLIIPAIVAIGVLIGKYMAAKTTNKIDDKAVEILEENQALVVSELAKLVKKASDAKKAEDAK